MPGKSFSVLMLNFSDFTNFTGVAHNMLSNFNSFISYSFYTILL